MASLLLVEDNRDLARGLMVNLKLEGHSVTHCASGDAVMGLLSESQYDLIILDVMLPGQDGFSLLKTIRNRKIQTPILMLTARGEELDKVHALRRGADDYVTKPFGLMEFLARVEALLRRANQEANVATPSPAASGSLAVQNYGPWQINRASREVYAGETPIPLTPKEYRLLLTLADYAGQVVSRQQLLREVWGHSADVATRTVDTHMAELRRKLEPDPANPRYLKTARGIGYWMKL